MNTAVRLPSAAGSQLGSSARRLRDSGCPGGFGFRQSKRQGHRGPTGARGRHKLVRAMRETGIEPRLECQSAGLHVPGTVTLLGIQEELDSPLVNGIED